MISSHSRPAIRLVILTVALASFGSFTTKLSAQTPGPAVSPAPSVAIASAPATIASASSGSGLAGQKIAAVSPGNRLDLALPPAAPVRISDDEVAPFAPVAIALRALLSADLPKARPPVYKTVVRTRRVWVKGPLIKGRWVPGKWGLFSREKGHWEKDRRGKGKWVKVRRKVRVLVRPGSKNGSQRRELRALAKFYSGQDFVPVWYVKGRWSRAAKSVVTRLERAAEDGIQLGMEIPKLVGGADSDVARAERDLSRAVVRYGQYGRTGRINPGRVSGYITVKPDRVGASAILQKVATAEFAGDALHSYNPKHRSYVMLREKLAELRAKKEEAKHPKIGFGRTLRVGMKDKRVMLIRARFGLTADSDSDRKNVYDTKVAGAIRQFQRSRGLPAHGKLTRATIKALTSNNRKRVIAEIIANMERWRWLPHDIGPSYIMVNIPEYRARLFRGGAEIHSARVIVGKKKTQTPVFSDVMEYLVVNPYWNVPVSIIKKEMMPAFQRDPTYFQRKGYEVKEVGDRITVRQPPGPRNALGYVKFLFPNRHAVYMHDTPSRRLFRASARAFSHGCVRVQNPFKLAGLVLEGQQRWTEKRLRRMIGKDSRTIRLKRKLPVHIVYFTAFVDESGELQLRRDLYGHSAKLRKMMQLKG